MAEVPAFQEQSLIDADLNGRISDSERQSYIASQLTALKSNLTLLVNGQTAELQSQSQSLTFPPGQGGLDTLRLELIFSAVLPSQSQPLDIRYRDANYLDRAGWQEIVVQPNEAITLLGASVPAESLSQELREYPDDYLNQPVKVQEATFQYLPFAGAATDAAGESGAALSAVSNETSSLFAEESLSNLINIPAGPGPLLAAVLLASFWAHYTPSRPVMAKPSSGPIWSVRAAQPVTPSSSA
jgi:hypothetical protein